MVSNNVGFGIKTGKRQEGTWSFCIGLSHQFDETYIYINFARWWVVIGKIDKSY